MDRLDGHDGRAYSDGVALRVLLLVVALVSPTLTTLAHIDPPDPSWIGGYWDDDDFDSVVDSILHTCAVEPASPADVGPPRAFVAGSARSSSTRSRHRSQRPTPRAGRPLSS